MKVLRGNRVSVLFARKSLNPWYNVQISFLSVIQHKNITTLYLDLCLFNLLYWSLVLYLWKNLKSHFSSQKRAVRAMTNFNHLAPTFCTFIWTIDILDIFKVNSHYIAKFMFSYHHRLLPSPFLNLFLNSSQIQVHNHMSLLVLQSKHIFERTAQYKLGGFLRSPHHFVLLLLLLLRKENLCKIKVQTSDNISAQTAAPKLPAKPTYDQFSKATQIAHFLRFWKKGTKGKPLEM